MGRVNSNAVQGQQTTIKHVSMQFTNQLPPHEREHGMEKGAKQPHMRVTQPELAGNQMIISNYTGPIQQPQKVRIHEMRSKLNAGCRCSCLGLHSLDILRHNTMLGEHFPHGPYLSTA